MRTKSSVTALATVLLLLGLPLLVHAQCNTFEIVLADGRPTPITVPFNGSGTFVLGVFFRAAPGRSYSVEVYGGRAIPVSDIFLGGANQQSCSTSNAAGVRDIVDIEPRAFDSPTGPPSRFSLTVTAPITSTSSPFFLARIRNTSTTTAQAVTVTVTDTTLFNPLWSTFGNFETFYRFQNSTNASCSVTLEMVNDSNVVVATDTFAIPANSTAPTRNTGPTDLNVADNQAGGATITHDCPPGGIQVDGFLGLFTGGQSIVLPIRIQPARPSR